MVDKKWKRGPYKGYSLTYTNIRNVEFILLLEVYEKLASAIARFWWISNPPKRGMH